jgi:hypothetical protein
LRILSRLPATVFRKEKKISKKTLTNNPGRPVGNELNAIAEGQSGLD